MKRKRHRRRLRKSAVAVLILIVGLICFAIYKLATLGTGLTANDKIKKAETLILPRWVDEQIIHKHTTARSGKKLTDIKNIVIHYVGNPNTTAQNNRDYFNRPTTTVSSHFIVGLDGEIIQCVPLYEKSAASNNRNKDTISIETCHPDESGKFNKNTYKSLVRLTAYLCYEFDLSEQDVIRHYDITGKICPKYYAENYDEWQKFKEDVRIKINEF